MREKCGFRWKKIVFNRHVHDPPGQLFQFADGFLKFTIPMASQHDEWKHKLCYISQYALQFVCYNRTIISLSVLLCFCCWCGCGCCCYASDLWVCIPWFWHLLFSFFHIFHTNVQTSSTPIPSLTIPIPFYHIQI